MLLLRPLLAGTATRAAAARRALDLRDEERSTNEAIKELHLHRKMGAYATTRSTVAFNLGGVVIELGA
jgi:hypothetical protein